MLVGDAAHPVGASQGASIALEDAVAPATALADAPIPDALAAFDRARHDRTVRLAKGAAADRDAKTAGPIAACVRNAVMPLVFGRFHERATGWLYDHRPGELPQGHGTLNRPALNRRPTGGGIPRSDMKNCASRHDFCISGGTWVGVGGR